MKNSYYLLLGLVLIASGCSSGVRFYVSPHELAAEVKAQNDLGQKKEILAGQDYRVIVVQKGMDGLILPVQHYRPEHTYSNRVHPRIVTYEDPLTLTALIIVDALDNTNGIAIKKSDDKVWRIYWIKESDIKNIRQEGVVYLPPYEDLPVLQISKERQEG